MPFGKCLVFGEKASEMMSKKSGDESHFNNITEKSVHSLNGISGYSERSRISGNQGLNLLFNNLHEGVILLNRYGVIQEWNPVMEQFYGYLREDCVGKVFQEIVHQLFHETVFESAQYKKFIKAVKSLSAAVIEPVPQCLENIRLISKDQAVTNSRIVYFAIAFENEQLLVILVNKIDRTNLSRPKDFKNEEFYRSIVEHQDELVIRISPEAKVTFVNDAFVKTMGISQERIKGRNVLSLFSRDKLQSFRQMMHQLTTIPERTVFEEEFFLRNGEHRWMQWVGIPIFAASGELREIQGVGRDITNLKRIEETVKIQRDLALALNHNINLPEMFAYLSQVMAQLKPFDFCIFLTLDYSCQMIRLMNSHGLSKKVEDCFQSLSFDSACGELILRTQPIYCRWKQMPFSSWFEVEDSFFKGAAIIPICYEGKTIASMVMGTREVEVIADETRRQLEGIAAQTESLISGIRAKSNLLEREKDLKSLFESIDDMLLIIGLDGKIIEVNPAVTRRLGYEVDEWKALTLFDLHQKKDRDAVEDFIKTMKIHRHATTRLPLVTKGGDKIDAEMDLAYGNWGGNKVLIGLCRDISQRIQIERMEHEQRELASALADVAAILNSSLNLDDVLDHILDTLGKIVSNTTSNIILLEGKNGRVVRSQGYDKLGTEEMLKARVYDVQKIKNFSKMYETRQAVFTSDPQKDADWLQMPESMWVRSFVGAPIVSNDQVLGFLNCDSDTPGFYTEKQAASIKLFADQAAIAIENARLYSETKHRLQQLAMINELTHAVLDTKKIEEIFKSLPEKMLALFDASSVLITQWNSVNRSVTRLASINSSSLPNSPRTFEINEKTLTEEVLREGKALVITDKINTKLRDDRFNKEYLERSVLALPLIVDDQPIGAILVGFKTPQQITETEISIGEYASTQIALAISKTLSLEEEKKQSEQLTHANDLIASLSSVAVSIKSAAGPTGVIRAMGEGLEKMQILSVVSLLDRDTQVLIPAYFSREIELEEALEKFGYSSIEELTIPVSKVEELNNAIFQQQVVFVDDPFRLTGMLIPTDLGPFISKIQTALAVNRDTRALILPLVTEQKSIGVLDLYGKNLQEIDRRAAEIFGSQISSALENSKLLAEVQRLAVTDELTGIYNRRGLFENGNREFNIATRIRRPLSVLMIDLDNFKVVNDKYGHAIGDVALTEVARRISRNIRDIDIVGRYGGEEFVVMLLESDLARAIQVADRIRCAIGDKVITTDDSPVQVTVSIGVEELTPSFVSLEQIIKNSDRALYTAKHNGRNQVATIAGSIKI